MVILLFRHTAAFSIFLLHLGLSVAIFGPVHLILGELLELTGTGTIDSGCIDIGGLIGLTISIYNGKLASIFLLRVARLHQVELQVASPGSLTVAVTIYRPLRVTL